ncbi:MAG: hypothetical protein WKF77_25535 [Planctomycetaceae bacterium]
MDSDDSFLPDAFHEMLARFGTQIEYSECSPEGCVNLARTEVANEDLADLVCYPGFAKLNLAHTGISDIGLRFIGELTSLEQLSLEGTRITDAGLVEIAGLSNLDWLHIGDSWMGFPGKRPVPASDVPREMQIGNDALGFLTGLRSLDTLFLTGTRVTDVGVLKHIPDLQAVQKLGLDLLDITDQGLFALHSMPSLRSISLAHTGVSDDGIVELVRQSLSVEKLTLGNTAVSDTALAQLSDLAQITKLALFDTGITNRGLESISHLPNLSSLNLDRTSVTDAGITHLARLVAMQKLSLNRTTITDRSLAEVSNLEIHTLSASFTAVTDKGMSAVCRLQSLQDLSLDGNNITDVGLRILSEGTNRRSLYRTEVTNSGLSVLARMPLECLCLSVSIDDVGIRNLSQIATLSQLSLRSIDVSSLDGFSRLTELVWLTIMHGTVIDLSPLMKLSNLKVLTYHAEGIQASEVARLRRALPQCQIDISIS